MRKAVTRGISGNHIIKPILGLNGKVAAGFRTIRAVAPVHLVLTHLLDHTKL